VIAATVDLPEEGASGVILAAGSRFGGYVLYMEDGRLAYEYNFGEVRYRAIGDAPVEAGRRSLAWRFVRTGPRRGAGALFVDGASVATIDLPDTWPYTVAQAGVHCGRDEGSTVSDRYAAPFAFTGTIDRVVVAVADGPGGEVPAIV
jgi:arylsulfatase